jgi:hypothetical protein
MIKINQLRWSLVKPRVAQPIRGSKNDCRKDGHNRR